MSIVKNNNKLKKGLYISRFLDLAKLQISVFHAGDLASLWQIQDTHNLHMTLKRYADKGLLVRIYRGLYSLKPVEQIDSRLLGIKALHSYAYISTETILAEVGIIQQKINLTTVISAKSKRFSIGSRNFYSRKLADKFLYNEIGIIERDGIKIATSERAVADLLYFNSKYYFDAEKLIDWKKVKAIQKALGYPLTSTRYKKQTYDFT